MSRGSSLILLAVLGAGVFLAGLELMITAVALPSIVVDLADWTQLRHASWIVNGYLLAYVVTMPLAGRLSDLLGARRVFMAALAAFIVGSLLAGAAPEPRPAHRGAPRPGRRRRHAGAGRDGRRGPSLRRSRPDRGALGVIGALTFLGMAAGPFAGAALLGAIHAESALAAAGFVAGGPVDFLTPSWRWVFYVNVPIGIVALAFACRPAPAGRRRARPRAWTCRGAGVQRRARRPARRPDAARSPADGTSSVWRLRP